MKNKKVAIILIILLAVIIISVGVIAVISDIIDNKKREGGRFVLEKKGSLISTLLKQYKEGNKVGLVKDSKNKNLYYYIGTKEEVSNNFLWYGGHQWRILEFDTSDNTITIITEQPLTAILAADTVWKTKEEYEESYVNTWLNQYFWNSLDDSIKTNIKDSTFNVGIYYNENEMLTTQKARLLDEKQYIRAGAANSYLNIKDYWWLGNRNNSSRISFVCDDGHSNCYSQTSTRGVRAVIKISDITISSGNGTFKNSYRPVSKATNTNNVQVGEYINVPYNGDDNACGKDNMCTFRVVSKDSDSIKIILNGLLPTTSSYGSSATISTSHAIYTKLNKFSEGISDTYQYTGNKEFYIGDYPYISGIEKNYTNVQKEKLEASIGLPTVGEMFSGNDIDLSTSNKTFIDINTLENPTISKWYWTMNRMNASEVHFVSQNGVLSAAGPTSRSNYSFSNYGGVRAVIYLKSGDSAKNFAGGEGTAQSPYILQ